MEAVLDLDDWGAFVGCVVALALGGAAIVPVLIVRGVRRLWRWLDRSSSRGGGLL